LPGPDELVLIAVLVLLLVSVLTLLSLLFRSWPLGPVGVNVVVVEIVVVVVVSFVPLLLGDELGFAGLPLLPCVLGPGVEVEVEVVDSVDGPVPHPLCCPAASVLEGNATLAIANAPRVAVTFRVFRMSPPPPPPYLLISHLAPNAGYVQRLVGASWVPCETLCWPSTGDLARFVRRVPPPGIHRESSPEFHATRDMLCCLLIKFYVANLVRLAKSRPVTDAPSQHRPSYQQTAVQTSKTLHHNRQRMS
jgi:hypothetical protein